ncbi:MAG: hypothetical protein HDS69_09630 [Bacteroidales bacterium]|nr:hypothetical protein [Bacteroidales bacterium]
MIGSLSCNAKSYPFKANRERNVTISQSAAPGTKIVKVVSYAGSAKKAIDLALQDAVYTAMFTGISGNGEFEKVPPILVDGINTYANNKKFFNKFFKTGDFMPYAHLVNSEFPSGLNNVSSPKGRKVTVYIIIDHSSLTDFLSKSGYKTFTDTFKSL